MRLRDWLSDLGIRFTCFYWGVWHYFAIRQTTKLRNRLNKLLPKCPSCGSELGFTRGFPLETEQSQMRPEADDLIYFDYTHLVCPKCGFEGKEVN